MTTTDEFSLEWKDFKNNASTTFLQLRESRDFSDVTLACEDGDQIEAHKVVLAGGSPFFMNLLKRNQHTHPLIYLRGIKKEHLSAMVDFMYSGEAKVPQDSLEAFLAAAEELKVKGLVVKSPTQKKETPASLKTKEIKIEPNCSTQAQAPAFSPSASRLGLALALLLGGV